MSKARKSKAKPPMPAVESVGRQPLRGIEKAAWWSVPAVGAVALVCASTIGVLFLNKPATVVSDSKPASKKKVEKTAQPKAQRETKQASREPDVKPSTTETENSQMIGEAIPFTDLNPETAVASEAATPKVVAPVSVAAKIAMSLTCTQGKISYEGKQKLAFVDKQPAVEVIEGGNVKFAHLVFDGVDQSAELSTIPRGQGSLEIVALMPDRVTSVILDSSFQRMTLRKNRDGLRWRIAGERKMIGIRLIEKSVNFNQWHHVMMTWKDGEDAILYVDGVEQDRYPYVHEQRRFAEFEKVVVGRTRGPNGRFYKSRVHKLVVYDHPIASAKVSELNQAVRQTYPFIFK